MSSVGHIYYQYGIVGGRPTAPGWLEYISMQGLLLPTSFIVGAKSAWSTVREMLVYNP